jgi:hypothetical protein
MFSYDPDIARKVQAGEVSTNDPSVVGMAVATPELLSRRYGTGGSWLDSFTARADFAAYEGGTGTTLFGYARTPQRFFADQYHGFDPDLGNKPDPNWNPQAGKEAFARLATDTQLVAIRAAGGAELEQEIINNSVSEQHMRQRLRFIEITESARLSIDLADNQASMFGYGATKTSSALLNYVFSDPLTVVSVAVSGGVGSALSGVSKAGAAASGVSSAMSGASSAAANATRYARLSSFVASRPNLARSAMYLWDGMDGAQSSYSYWLQTNTQNKSVYGETRQLDDNWTDDVAFGAALGLGFSLASDMLPRMFKTDGSRNISRPESISAVENIAAKAGQHLGTEADVASMSLWHNARKDLDNALDLTEGPESHIRKVLTDGESRKYLGWDDTASLQELSDFIKNNRPNQNELSEFVYSKLKLRVDNHAATVDWSNQLERHLSEGGDSTNFFKKKAVDFLRSHMGEEFSKYRFLVDTLYEATGDMAQVAEWMARGDKPRVVRAVSALNQSKLEAKLQAQAVDRAIEAIAARGAVATKSENIELLKSFADQLREGRWSGAVSVLNDMFKDAQDIAGKRLAQIDAAVQEMDRLYGSLNYSGRKRLREYNRIRERLVEFRRVSAERGITLADARADVDRFLSPEATVDEVLNYANKTKSAKPQFESFFSRNVDDVDEMFESLKDDIRKFLDLEDKIDVNLRQVRDEAGFVKRLAGRDSLNKTITFIGTFPRSNVSFTTAGFNAVMEGAARQTMIGNRWKVDFVDTMLGEGAASNAMKSGSMPLRPVKTAQTPVQRFTVAEQDAILSKELAVVEPQIQASRAASKDVDAEAAIQFDRNAAETLRQAAAKATAMAQTTQNKSMAKKLNDLAEKRNKMAKRIDRLADRKQAALEGRIAKLNEDIPTTPSPISRETAEINRRNAAMQTSRELQDKVNALSPEDMSTSAGRKLRNKARNAAAEINGVTEYGKSVQLRNMLSQELEAAQKRVSQLEGAGSLDGDPVLKEARNEIKYLEKQLNKTEAAIKTVEGRPAAMRRSHELMGDKPNVNDIIELSRLRAMARLAHESNNIDEAERLVKEIYEKFGDSTRLPQWAELEDLIKKIEPSTNPTKDVITGIKADGRDLIVTVQRNENIPDEVFKARAKSKEFKTEAEKTAYMSAWNKARKSNKANRELDTWMTAADEEWTEARKAFVPTTEEIRITPTTISQPINPKAESTSAIKAADDAEPNKSELINTMLDKLSPGERLLITNAAAVAAARNPLIAGLGRSVLRLMAAGTAFGDLQTVSRHLDAIVASFNMLDNPESAVKSIGFNKKTHQSYQFFRDDARRIVNEIAAVLQRVQKDLTADSNQNIRRALDTGALDGLTSAERELTSLMQRHLQRVGKMYAESRGRAVEPNWRPRVGNNLALIARSREAINNFAEVYLDHYLSGARAIPKELAAEIGVPPETTWTALSKDKQDLFLDALKNRVREDAAETVARQSNNLTLDGAEGRIASSGPRSEYARTLENEVANDPRIARWYLATPIDEFAYYMEHSYPIIGFEAQLSKMIGTPTNFDDFIQALTTRFASIPDPDIRREATDAIKKLKHLWDYQTGRVQYRHNSLLDPTQRVGVGVIRAGAGSFWGLASLSTEVPRAVMAAKMYGGTVISGIGDLLSAIKNSSDISILSDIAHAADQYRSMTHSAYGSSIGTTTYQRFSAPWERFISVARGKEAVTTGDMAMNRFSGSTTAFFEALGDTAMRAGGLQLFSGWARVIADRQAKRYIFRNISNITKLAEELEAIGAVEEFSTASAARFSNLAKKAGIAPNVAIQLNHAGLLNKQVLNELTTALTGITDPVMDLGLLRTRLSDEAYGAVANFLTAAHNFHVPTGSLAQSAPASSAIEKMFYALTNYARAFSINVGYRSFANGSMGTVLATTAAVMIGENLYQHSRDVITGKRSIQDIEDSYRTNFVGEFTKNAARTPWLGAHHSGFMSVVDELTGMNGSFSGRGGGTIGPLLSAYRKASKAMFENAETGERDYEFFRTYTPFINAWYTRMAGQALEN